MKAFGSAGAGVFAVPTSVADEIATTFDVEIIGQTVEMAHQTYAISGERRSRHPAVAAISLAANANANANATATATATAGAGAAAQPVSPPSVRYLHR